MANALQPALQPANVFRNFAAGQEARQGNALNQLQMQEAQQGMTDRAADRTDQQQQKAMVELMRAGLMVKSLPQEQQPSAYNQLVTEVKQRFPQQLARVPEQYFEGWDVNAKIAHFTPEQARDALLKMQGITPPEPYTLNAGDRRFGGDNQMVAEAPLKSDAMSPELFDQKRQLAREGRAPRGGAGGSVKAPVGYRQTASGLEAIPGGPADPANPLNTKRLDAPARYSPKEVQTARQKLNLIRIAQDQLNKVKENWAALAGNGGALSAGPFGAGMIPTESGNNFDAAIDQLRGSITGLKRVPGVGSMSDYETRLEQAMLPSRREYESSTQQKIDGLQEFLNNLNGGYEDIVGGAAAQTTAVGQQGAQGGIKFLGFEK